MGFAIGLLGDEILDEKLRLLLTDLTRSLHDAISDDPSVAEKLQRLQEQGYTLQLLLDCQPSPDETDLSARAIDPVPPEPIFRINGRDLAFLRSVGIDPTRRMRKQKQRRKTPDWTGR